jgi:hypothetical protein
VEKALEDEGCETPDELNAFAMFALKDKQFLMLNPDDAEVSTLCNINLNTYASVY